MIKVDLDRAKEYSKNLIREYRKPLLTELDGQFTRALEEDNIELKTEVINKKQELRDLTKHPVLEDAQTPEELKQFLLDNNIIKENT